MVKFRTSFNVPIFVLFVFDSCSWLMYSFFNSTGTTGSSETSSIAFGKSDEYIKAAFHELQVNSNSCTELHTSWWSESQEGKKNCRMHNSPNDDTAFQRYHPLLDHRANDKILTRCSKNYRFSKCTIRIWSDNVRSNVLISSSLTVSWEFCSPVILLACSGFRLTLSRTKFS